MGKIQQLLSASIDALRSGKRSDSLTPGLYIEVNESGRKIWHYRRRIAKSCGVVKMQLGTFPAYIREAAACQAMTVAKAHELYMQAMRRGDRKRLKPRTIKDKEVIFTRDIESRSGRVQ